MLKLPCINDNVHSKSPILSVTVTTLYDWTSDCVVTVNNCQQSCDYMYTAICSSVTTLPALVNSHNTVNVKSQCSDCAQQVTVGIGLLLCIWSFIYIFKCTMDLLQGDGTVENIVLPPPHLTELLFLTVERTLQLIFTPYDLKLQHTYW